MADQKNISNELEALENLNDDFEFAKQMLIKVSRTFALNINFLKGDLYKSVLLSYLFCRIIDTIEDSQKLSFEDKIQALKMWENFFPFQNNWEQSLEKFIQYASINLTDNEYETLLVRNSKRIFMLFRELDPAIHKLIAPWIKEMSMGMAKFQKMAMESKKKPYCLKNREELEKYCYYVAGTVGNMLKDLFLYFFPDISLKQKEIMEKNAVSFGLGLQITNIIKDFKDDGIREWCFIPENLLNNENLSPDDLLKNNNMKSRGRVLNNLIDITKIHLDNALKFSLALPRNYSLRMFCFLPMHFAIQTLSKAKEIAQTNINAPIKISRKSVKNTILFTIISCYSNFIQKTFYLKYRKKL